MCILFCFCFINKAVEDRGKSSQKESYWNTFSFCLVKLNVNKAHCSKFWFKLQHNKLIDKEWYSVVVKMTFIVDLALTWFKVRFFLGGLWGSRFSSGDLTYVWEVRVSEFSGSFKYQMESLLIFWYSMQ